MESMILVSANTDLLFLALGKEPLFVQFFGSFSALLVNFPRLPHHLTTGPKSCSFYMWLYMGGQGAGRDCVKKMVLHRKLNDPQLDTPGDQALVANQQIVSLQW